MTCVYGGWGGGGGGGGGGASSDGIPSRIHRVLNPGSAAPRGAHGPPYKDGRGGIGGREKIALLPKVSGGAHMKPGPGGWGAAGMGACPDPWPAR